MEPRTFRSGAVGAWRSPDLKVRGSICQSLNAPSELASESGAAGGLPGSRVRAAAIDRASAGANKLWAGAVTIQPNAKTGPHHQGALESIIYVVHGRTRMRWGEQLEYCAEAGPGDFIFVPPFVPHQEINANVDESLECVVVRSDQEPIVVNLDIPVADRPEQIFWIDPAHPKQGG